MAELCSVLGPHMIPLLPSLLPRVLQHVGEVKTRYYADKITTEVLVQ